MKERMDTESAPSLISEVLARLSNLVRKEIDLARAEVTENLGRARVAVGVLIAAVVLALTALDVLAAALVAALADLGLERGWAALAVGIALVLVAWGMARKGLNDLKLTSLAPTRMSQNLMRDAETIKEKFQ